MVIYVKVKLLCHPFSSFLFFPFFSFSRFLFGIRGKKRRHKKIPSTLFLCVVGRSSVVRVSLSQFQTHAPLSLLFARSLSLFLVQQKREEERVRKESSTAKPSFLFLGFSFKLPPRLSKSSQKVWSKGIWQTSRRFWSTPKILISTFDRKPSSSWNKPKRRIFPYIYPL